LTEIQRFVLNAYILIIQSYKNEDRELNGANIAPTSNVRTPNLILLLFIENYEVGVDFGVFSAAVINNSVLWNLAPCNQVDKHQLFGGARCLYLMTVLKMEAADSRKLHRIT
jgi:hypothetical protein